MNQKYKNQNIYSSDRVRGFKYKENFKKEIDLNGINGINGKPINLVCTLNTNKKYSEENFSNLIQLFVKRIINKIFRDQKYKNTIDFFDFYGFYEEKSLGQSHYHLLVHICEERKEWFKKIADKIWKKIIASGNVYIQDFDEEQKNEAFDYYTKCIPNDMNASRFIMSGMFLLEHQRNSNIIH